MGSKERKVVNGMNCEDTGIYVEGIREGKEEEGIGKRRGDEVINEKYILRNKENGVNLLMKFKLKK